MEEFFSNRVIKFIYILFFCVIPIFIFYMIVAGEENMANDFFGGLLLFLSPVIIIITSIIGISIHKRLSSTKKVNGILTFIYAFLGLLFASLVAILFSVT